MTVDYIRYDILTQDAMRSVVRTVMTDAATKGLPGDHHFFVSFDTRAEGVGLSPRLKAQYPKEMTIVLQHQFWDMIVTEERFEVGLSFSGIAERLVVPFRAITGFADPSVQFGLQFAAAADDEESAEDTPAEAGAARPPARHERPPTPVHALPTPANPDTGAKPAAKADKAPDTKVKSDKAKSDKSGAGQAATDSKPDKQPAGGGEVVRLDRFRKK
jgi:uncharacterized protein